MQVAQAQADYRLINKNSKLVILRPDGTVVFTIADHSAHYAEQILARLKAAEADRARVTA